MQWIAVKSKIKTKNITQSKSKGEEFSFLIFQTLIQNANNNNNTNNIFLNNFKNWYANNLIEYKNKLISEWKWWNPIKDKEIFNNLLHKIFKIIFKKIFFKWKINQINNLDIFASIYLINKFCFENNKEKKIWLEKTPINTSPDFFNWIIIDLWESQDFFLPIINLEENWLSISFMIYTILHELNVIPNDEIEQTKRYIEFISIATYNAYDYAQQLYENSHNTLLWISTYLKAEYIYDYFSKNRDRTKSLTKDVLNTKIIDNRWNKTTIQKLTEKRKQTVQKSLQSYDKAQELWLLAKTEYWIFIMDYDLQIPNWPEIATYKEKNLFKVFDSGDIYIYFPTWIPTSIVWKLDKIWIIVRNKSFFVKTQDEKYRKIVLSLLKLLWLKWNIESNIMKKVNEITKIEKQKQSLLTNQEQEKKKISQKIEKLSIENQELIKIINENKSGSNIILEDYNWVITQKLKYWLFINIWGITWLVHKSNCCEKSLEKNIWDIVKIKIIWIVNSNWKINLELEIIDSH